MSDSFDKRVRRQVKIVCTLGPSSSDAASILELAKAGMDVARLNFSHGTHANHKKAFEHVRSASSETGKGIAIMQDLQGPKIRLGKLEAPIELKKKDQVVLFPEGSKVEQSLKGKQSLPVSKEIAAQIAKDVKKGARVLFDDGKVMTTVLKVAGNEILVEVDVGGKLSSNKGMNLPGTPLSIGALSEKDIEDLKFGVSLGVDAVALSFVRSPQDIETVQKIIRKIATGSHPLVIAKMERDEAIQDHEAIVDVADGLLIARGDMAVELGADRVPVIQKQLIRACNELGVPVITATQMLESMISSPTPTRAEANDVANAVFDGTDAVMLSGETASGAYPIETVTTMSKIIQEAERNSAYSVHMDVRPIPGSIVDTVEYSAAKIAEHLGARAVVCITHSGRAVSTLAKYRPKTPIVAIVEREDVLQKLAMVWGVRSVLVPKILSTDDLFMMIEKVLKKNQIVEDGDWIVVTAGIPTLRKGTTNMVKVHQIGAAQERAATKALSN